MVEVFDLQLNRIGSIPHTWNNKLSLVLNKAGEFSFEAAIESINVETLGLEKDQILERIKHNTFIRWLDRKEGYLFTGMVNKIEKNEENSGEMIASIECYGMLHYLTRYNVRKRSYKDQQANQILADLLSQQSLITLGEIDFQDVISIDFAYESLHDAIFALQEVLGGDIYIDPENLTLNWVRRMGGIGPTIEYQRNMEFITFTSEATDHFTRIIPLGANAGEGENRITIESVNNGLDYIEADTAEEYGIIEVVWEDEKYQDPATLKLAAERMLETYKHPMVLYETSMIDLSQWQDEWGDNPFQQAEPQLGDDVLIIHPGLGLELTERIAKIERILDDDQNHLTGIELGEKRKSWADIIKEIQDRQNGNRYANGYNFTSEHILSAELSETETGQIKFYLDNDIQTINFSRLLFTASDDTDEEAGDHLSSPLKIEVNGNEVYSGNEIQKEIEIKDHLTLGAWNTILFIASGPVKIDATLHMKRFYNR